MGRLTVLASQIVAPNSTPETLYADARVRITKHRNLFFVVWHDAPDVTQMQVLSKVFAAGQSEHPEGVGCISAVMGGTPTFSTEVRAEVAALNKAAPLRFGMAHVILVGGLVGATVRAFLSTTLLLSRGQQVAKVFGTLDEGADWLVERMAGHGIAWTAPQIVSAEQAVIDLGPG